MKIQERRNLVTRTYKRAGIKAHWDLRLLENGLVYSNREVALWMDRKSPELAIHDFVHFLVAPEDRKYADNFGLGDAPHVFEKKHAQMLVTHDEASDEETTASALQIFVMIQLFGLTNAVMRVAEDMSSFYLSGLKDEMLIGSWIGTFSFGRKQQRFNVSDAYKHGIGVEIKKLRQMNILDDWNRVIMPDGSLLV